MSPGPIFERVYLALKAQVTGGVFAPGDRLEPAALGEALNASITPVRDALHRLVGERIVEAPRNEGFRVPMVTEFGLRQLYAWHTDLLRLAAARYGRAVLTIDQLEHPADTGMHPTSDIFGELARAAGDHELASALANTGERLASIRIIEKRFIPEIGAELEAFRGSIEAHDLTALRSAISDYQRRRLRVVPRIVAALQQPFR